MRCFVNVWIPFSYTKIPAEKENCPQSQIKLHLTLRTVPYAFIASLSSVPIPIAHSPNPPTSRRLTSLPCLKSTIYRIWESRQSNSAASSKMPPPLQQNRQNMKTFSIALPMTDLITGLPTLYFFQYILKQHV